MKKLLLALILLFAPHFFAAPSEPIVFEATVIKIGPQSNIKCGYLAVFTVAKYRVDKVWSGKLEGGEVVVDHLTCEGHEFDDVHQGDRLLLIAYRQSEPPLRVTTYAAGIREKGDPIKSFIVAQRVAKITRCCWDSK